MHDWQGSHACVALLLVYTCYTFPCATYACLLHTAIAVVCVVYALQAAAAALASTHKGCAA